MELIFSASWIKAPRFRHSAAIEFVKRFEAREVKKAELAVTARGVYDCRLNGKPVSDFVLAPGFTDYYHRLQYQVYDVTKLIEASNTLVIGVGTGNWFHCWYDEKSKLVKEDEPAVIAALHLVYEDDGEETVFTDETWKTRETQVRYNHIYNGETLDLTYNRKDLRPVKVIPYTKDILIPTEGAEVKVHEAFPGQTLIITPKGETVIDFGQEITGFVSFRAGGRAGDKITVKHFEMLDKNGNVYTENYRSAKSEFTVISDGSRCEVCPQYTFYGFRYIEVSGMKVTEPAEFTAHAVYSDMKRTGHFRCSDKTVNRLFENIIWGQKGNFLDVPTDCPQRDERLGWTGDAQVFCKVASYNFDTEKFFSKWLGDVRTCQRENGMIPNFVPCYKNEGGGSAAWADCCTVIPWQTYLTYGNKRILEDNYPMMEKWVGYMRNCAEHKTGKKFKGDPDIYLHNAHWHFGDWLALDLPDKEAVEGATDKNLIATAFYAYSVSILIKAGKVLGKDTAEYEVLYENIRASFRRAYMNKDGSLTSDTQTAAVLALQFGLTDCPEGTAKQLVRLIRKCGHLTTGFVGTPYLLHVLSDIGETRLAYDLLLRKEYPSWCYPVTMGATTMWERWNGLKPDGSFATKNMNSFNHYAYGAVGDWMYEHIAGIGMKDGSCAFRSLVFAPETDDRLTFAEASVETPRGTVASRWEKTDKGFLYTFTVPSDTEAEARIGGEIYTLHTGINKIEV